MDDVEQNVVSPSGHIDLLHSLYTRNLPTSGYVIKNSNYYYYYYYYHQYYCSIIFFLMTISKPTFNLKEE